MLKTKQTNKKKTRVSPNCQLPTTDCLLPILLTTYTADYLYCSLVTASCLLPKCLCACAINVKYISNLKRISIDI